MTVSNDPTAIVIYELEIKGHAPPFKWTVFAKSGATAALALAGMNGEAETLTDCVLDGMARARKYEHERVHRHTTRRVWLFTGNDGAQPPNSTAATDLLSEDDTPLEAA